MTYYGHRRTDTGINSKLQPKIIKGGTTDILGAPLSDLNGKTGWIKYSYEFTPDVSSLQVQIASNGIALAGNISIVEKGADPTPTLVPTPTPTVAPAWDGGVLEDGSFEEGSGWTTKIGGSPVQLNSTDAYHGSKSFAYYGSTWVNNAYHAVYLTPGKYHLSYYTKGSAAGNVHVVNSSGIVILEGTAGGNDSAWSKIDCANELTVNTAGTFYVRAVSLSTTKFIDGIKLEKIAPSTTEPTANPTVFPKELLGQDGSFENANKWTATLGGSDYVECSTVNSFDGMYCINKIAYLCSFSWLRCASFQPQTSTLRKRNSILV